jgi:hypothetical protein
LRDEGISVSYQAGERQIVPEEIISTAGGADLVIAQDVGAGEYRRFRLDRIDSLMAGPP